MRFKSSQVYAAKLRAAEKAARQTEARIGRRKVGSAVLYALLGAVLALVFAYTRPADVQSLGDKAVETVRSRLTR